MKRQSCIKLHQTATLAYILTEVSRGSTQIEIANSMKIPRYTISRFFKKAQQQNLIYCRINSRPRIYELTREGKLFLKNSVNLPKVALSSLGVRNPKTDIHRLRIKIPIVSAEKGANWDKEVELNNWIKKYKALNFPFSVTLEKTTKNIIIHAHEKEFVNSPKFLTELTIWISKILVFTEQYLRNKLGIYIDTGRARIIDQHMATSKEEYDPYVDPKLQVSTDLRRRARSILGSTSQRARAWVDRSKGVLELETNDLEYIQKLILMPEFVADLTAFLPESIETLQGFTSQISQHLEIMGEIKNGLAKWNSNIDKLTATENISSNPLHRDPVNSGGDTYSKIKEFWRKKHR